jgi:SAM-dependent methyltransferase
MRFSPPYSAYAQIYDRIGQRAFGERMAKVVLDLLANRGVRPASVLDLGCGTGSATLAFARAGLDATGVDRSHAMLERARHFADAEGHKVPFIEGDMADLQLPDRYDLVTCIYDALNYLDDDRDVVRFLLNAYRHLEADGYLVFDMNTRARLESSWEQGLVLAADSDDLYVTYRSWFDPSIDASPLVMTAFVRDESGGWQRFDEEHIERAWPIEQVTAWLRATGFHLQEVLGYVDATGEVQRPAREAHGRVVFVASR